MIYERIFGIIKSTPKNTLVEETMECPSTQR